MEQDTNATVSQRTDDLPKPWVHSLKQFAERALGSAIGLPLWQKYHTAFSADYQSLVSPRYALQDILHLEQISGSCDHVSLLKPCQSIADFRLHFYSTQLHYLDVYIPVLENMHLRVIDQVQFTVSVGGHIRYIRSFVIQAKLGQYAALALLRQRLLATIQAMLSDKAENDGLNKLVVLAGLSWQQIAVLRAYLKYYLQLGHPVTTASIHHALLHNPTVALGLFNYFEARFRPDPAWDDPAIREEQALSPLRLQLLEHIATVADINDDRILRTLFNLIDATMRSNFHVRHQHPDFFIAFKINSLGVFDMPAPRPQNEIFVYAVDMQGIHLRAGKISRGGIRWSDRPDDFRTEILDLMQTQISKNALIIPTGAKGGFVVKKNGQQDFKAAGKKAYLTLIHGLLDLTDNYSKGKIVKLANIVAYDDPDPYLVVAADKGTASFSDMANAVAAEYTYWLGDGFASGGSHGYDHKALGITARGAWECVKRHFHELGLDTQTQAFTVVGIGSMDGDVFGNGMLLSPCIRLVAAFSGQHIFIDPNPPKTDAPFNERRRLFAMPGSSWDDYDRNLISAGGGVYLRSAKNIPVSPELQKWLGIRYKTLDGETLVRYLLTAQVDLLWLGGIGTYVKASSEKHEEVGDRNNDNVRVDAATLRAKVVGEGANLGFTQKARIEYALGGGRINTDAVDNSAGVDTSDHEVNLKILLTGLQKQGLIADYQPLFIEMTDAVCNLVLADNIAQSLSLSLEQRRNAEDPEKFLQLAERLENRGYLDRDVESFPGNKEILARPGQTLTRPELAALMAASKRYVTEQIEEAGQFLQGESCACYLESYFPAPIRGHYKAHLSTHPLAHAITATVISNKIINQCGCGFLGLEDDIAVADVVDSVCCYLTFDRALNADSLRKAIHDLDNVITADKQYPLLLQLENTLADLCSWTLMQNQKIHPDKQTLVLYRNYLKEYQGYFSSPIYTQTEAYQTRFLQYQKDGIPDELTRHMLFIANLKDFPFIVSLANATQLGILSVRQWINDVNDFLGLTAMTAQLAKLPKHDNWQRKIMVQLEIDMHRAIALLISDIVRSNSLTCTDYFNTHIEKQNRLERYRQLYQEVMAILPINILPYIALIKTLQRLLESV
ncbi:MAG: NAD-glutamate dehydrogenase domain-containing protein [Methyloglobulus sp.]|nr:NAD-glutamate dehydrogenase [Methyloglobulus sp.]